MNMVNDSNKINKTYYEKYKHIAVTIDNYNRLRKLGKFGDSFNDIITKLLSHS